MSAPRPREREFPVIELVEEKLTVLVAPDDDQYTAYCPDLDLAVASDSPEQAVVELLEAMREYAEDYLGDLSTFSRSPNRAHHLPYVKVIAACESEWELRRLVAVRYGQIHV